MNPRQPKGASPTQTVKNQLIEYFMGHQPNSGASGDVNEAGPPRYFYFNRLVQESGNVPRDKAMLKIEFEKALDEFFDRRPHTITVANEVERL